MMLPDRSIPWNDARFLNDCTDRLLLQRVGGRYRFVHQRFTELDGWMGGWVDEWMGENKGK